MSKKTKCPNCQALFTMPRSKLGNPNARARCGHCKNIFALNANLVEEVEETSDAKQDDGTPFRTPVSPFNESYRAASMGFSHDLLSDDEMDDFLNKARNIGNNSSSDSQNTSSKEAALKNIKQDLKEDLSLPRIPVLNKKERKAKMDEMNLESIIPLAEAKPKKSIRLSRLKKLNPTAQQLASKKSFGAEFLWLIGVLVLAGLLLFQLVIFNMSSLVKNPAIAAQLNTICAIAGCSVPSADLNNFKITPMLSADHGAANVIIVIKNESGEEQLYPNLLVQLKDANKNVIADYIASTNDYLGESQTTMLAGQYKRIMLTSPLPENGTIMSVKVIPFYDQPAL